MKKIKSHGVTLEVSSGGSVRQIDREHRGRILPIYPLIPTVSPAGTRYVSAYHRGKQINFYVHRLVAEAYLPNPKNLPCVKWRDGNRANCNADNLEWVRFGGDTPRIPPRHCTLTPQQVREIRDLIGRGVSGVEIAGRYHVSQSTISLIKSRKRWTTCD